MSYAAGYNVIYFVVLGISISCWIYWMQQRKRRMREAQQANQQSLMADANGPPPSQQPYACGSSPAPQQGGAYQHPNTMSEDQRRHQRLHNDGKNDNGLYGNATVGSSGMTAAYGSPVSQQPSAAQGYPPQQQQQYPEQQPPLGYPQPCEPAQPVGYGAPPPGQSSPPVYGQPQQPDVGYGAPPPGQVAPAAGSPQYYNQPPQQSVDLYGHPTSGGGCQAAPTY